MVVQSVLPALPDQGIRQLFEAATVTTRHAPSAPPRERARTHATRLLFVVNDADFFVSHRLPIAEAALREGYDVHLATGPSSAAALARVRQSGVHYHPLAFHGQSMSLAKEVAGLLALLRLFLRLQPDIVHLVTPKVVLYGGIAARIVGVRAVVSALCGLGYLHGTRGPVMRLLRSLLAVGFRYALGHRNQRVIVQNHDDLNQVLRTGLGGRHLVLIPGSGVDLRCFRPEPFADGTPIVLLPARMLWEKGIGEFVEAARILKGRGLRCRMVLAGTASHPNPSTVPVARLRAWVAEGAVEWWGHREDMPEVLAQAHIVCLPSYYREGIPKSLLEAAACGRPVVTTDSVGCREAIEPGVTGLLVPPRDALRLADAIAELLADPARRVRMGQAGRQRAERLYSIDSVVTATLQQYRQLQVA